MAPTAQERKLRRARESGHRWRKCTLRALSGIRKAAPGDEHNRGPGPAKRKVGRIPNDWRGWKTDYSLSHPLALCVIPHMGKIILLPCSGAFSVLTISATRQCRKDTATMASPHSPKQNHLLAALPAEDYARLLPHLELAPMPLGWAL